MVLDPMAGKPASNDMLENIPRLVSLYYSTRPDPANASQRVSFGTSGHRGSSLKKSFCEAHILAISQALADYRKSRGIDGPLFIGIDTHALSEPAFISALEVFAGNAITVMIQKNGGYTPTPVISHAILTYNSARTSGFADGVVITPSHNPPSDGGFKYNPTNGGPADTDITSIIESAANVYLEKNLDGVIRIPYEKAIKADTTIEHDYVMPYVNDLENVVDMARISESGLKIGADPLGGSGVAYWDVIAERYKLNIEVVNNRVDPSFSFMTLDKDGKIRMDCSSPYAMAGLIGLKDRFDIAFANDPDFDRHGIVTRSKGILNPNHYLAVAINYLCKNRPAWGSDKAIGKTLVSSSMIDKVANDLGRKIIEVPVGFKWFVPGLNDGSVCFGGEESAGASFLRHDGSVWSTDKDGIIMNLLSAEMIAVTGKDPGELYDDLTRKHGAPVYERIDAPATPEQKSILKNLSPEQVSADNLAGNPITGKLTKAPGNGASIGGLKVITDKGWFAARPSGTEDVYKIYAESFVSEDHLNLIQKEAKEIVDNAFITLT